MHLLKILFDLLFNVLQEFKVGEGIVHPVLDHFLDKEVTRFSVLPENMMAVNVIGKLGCFKYGKTLESFSKRFNLPFPNPRQCV